MLTRRHTLTLAAAGLAATLAAPAFAQDWKAKYPELVFAIIPAENATGVLALAQRLHDEYVANGREEGDRIVADARQQGEHLVREAEEKRDQTLQQLESERSTLEKKIDELRTFEREYRQRLKSYLEGLLNDVEQRTA